MNDMIRAIIFALFFTIILVFVSMGLSKLITMCEQPIPQPQSVPITPLVIEDTLSEDNRLYTIVNIKNRRFLIVKWGSQLTMCPYEEKNGN